METMFDGTAVTVVGMGGAVEVSVDDVAVDPWDAVTIPGEPPAFMDGDTLVIARCAAWR